MKFYAVKFYLFIGGTFAAIRSQRNILFFLALYRLWCYWQVVEDAGLDARPYHAQMKDSEERHDVQRSASVQYYHESHWSKLACLICYMFPEMSTSLWYYRI
jgi:hypothetical protein